MRSDSEVNRGSANSFRPGDSPGNIRDAVSGRYGRLLAGLFLGASALLLLAAYIYFSDRQADAKAAAQRELNAIADIKLRQMADWREERLSDGSFFARARFVARDLQRIRDEPGAAGPRSDVEHWLTLLKGGDRYSAVRLFDQNRQQLLAVPNWPACPMTRCSK